MVDMGRRGSWQAQEQDALGGVEVQERREPVDLKKTAGAFRNRKPDGPGTSQGRTGGKQAIGFLGFLDVKTLKHAKTTEAENGVR
jgi:hypothetical protein